MGIGGLPEFRYAGIILDPVGLRYSPNPDIIHPSVIDTARLERPLARYYMYYAPHDAPGGICLAYSDTPEGPWREYEHNPIIGFDWAPHYQVSHVSSPHAIWNPGEQQLFLYFHGENNTTRFAVSSDGIHFEYGDAAVTCDMFEPGVTEASYARIFQHPLASKYFMLLMGNCNGTRNIYIAWSEDGRKWTANPHPLVTPPPGTSQMGPGWLLPWNGRYYLICFANLTEAPTFDPISDLYLYEVNPDITEVTYFGKLMDHTAAGPDNARINDPCILVTEKRLYLFINVGRRLGQSIGLAIASLDTATHGDL